MKLRTTIKLQGGFDVIDYGVLVIVRQRLQNDSGLARHVYRLDHPVNGSCDWVTRHGRFDSKVQAVRDTLIRFRVEHAAAMLRA